MKILVINCGSSSIKYKLYDMANNKELAAGLIERIGETQSNTTHTCNGEKFERNDPIETYDKGISQIIELLTTCGSPPPIKDASEINGVGHRVVHGGEDFAESVVVDDKSKQQLKHAPRWLPCTTRRTWPDCEQPKPSCPATAGSSFRYRVFPDHATGCLHLRPCLTSGIRRRKSAVTASTRTSHRYITEQPLTPWVNPTRA